jgi:hypothetical protein
LLPLQQAGPLLSHLVLRLVFILGGRQSLADHPSSAMTGFWCH